jgi:hypothetical protein
MTIIYKMIAPKVWGIGSTQKLATGAIVTVKKKDGTEKKETVASPIGEKDGLFLYTIMAQERPISSRRPSGGGYGRRCPNCGSHEVMCDANGKPYFCDECDSI